MHGILAVALVLALPASVARAAEDYVPWTEATFAAELPAPYGRVLLNLKVEPSGRLLDVAVQRDGGVDLRIPAVAYADIAHVQIGRARAAYKRGFDGSPWMFVHIPFGEPIYVRNQPEWTILVIAFRGDRAVYRALNVPRPRGGFDWLPTDLPRE